MRDNIVTKIVKSGCHKVVKNGCTNFFYLEKLFLLEMIFKQPFLTIFIKKKFSYSHYIITFYLLSLVL